MQARSQSVASKSRGMKARGSSLGNIPKFASKLEIIDFFPAHVAADSLDRRHWLAKIQAKVLHGMGYAHRFKSLSLCMSGAIPASGTRKDGSTYYTGSPGKVQMHKYPETDEANSSLGYAWVTRCASAMLCFTCAPKIRWKRSQEVRTACEWMLSHGRTWAMVTLTAPHYADIDPVLQADRFMAAMRRLKSGRWWQDFKAWSGYEHAIRALEMTLTHPVYGLGAGAHLHDHALWFFKREPFSLGEGEKFRADLLEHWRDCLLAEGIEIRDMTAFENHGVDVKLPTARGRVVNDPAKLKDVADYISDRAACEISPGIFSKEGKIERHISHFEFMALALTWYPEARPYMIRIMQALRGRSWMQWTRGLKALVGVEEKTDAELLKEEKAKPAYTFEREDWKVVNREKLQRRIVRAVEQDIDQVKKDRPSDEEVDLDVYSESIRAAVVAVAAGWDPLILERLRE